MSDWSLTDEKQSKFQRYAKANLEISEMWTELRAAIAEIERLKQRCADSDAVNARYVRRVAELTDSAKDWHRVADARAEELVKLQQRVAELELDAERGWAYASDAATALSSAELKPREKAFLSHLECALDEKQDAAIDAAKAGERGEG